MTDPVPHPTMLMASVSWWQRPIGATKLGEEDNPHSFTITFGNGVFMKLASWQVQPTEGGMLRAAARQIKDDWLRWGVQKPEMYAVLRNMNG